MVTRSLNILLALVLLAASFTPGLARQDAERSSFSGLRLLSSGENGIELEFSAPVYEHTRSSQDGKEFDQLSVPGAATISEAGKPQLPRISALLGVPPGVEIDLQIIGDHAAALPGRFELRTARRPAPLEEDFQPGGWLPASEPESFTGSGLYPSAPAWIADEGWLRGQRIVWVEFAPFQYDLGRKTVLRRSALRVALRFSGAQKPVAPAAVQEDPLWEPVLHGLLFNYPESRSWRGSPAANARPSTVTASLGPRYKIVVDQDGLYRLTYQDLQNAGMPVDSVDPSTFRMLSQGQAVAIQVVETDGNLHKFSPGESVLFYGEKFRGDRMASRYATEDDLWPSLGGWQPHLTAAMFEKYTDENVYWLLAGGIAGPRIGTVDGTPGSAPIPAYFYHTVRAEESHAWWTFHFTGEDTWFWERITPGPVDVVTRTYDAVLTALASDVLTATVRGEVVSRSTFSDHHVQFKVNSQAAPVADISWDGRSRQVFEGQVSPSALKDGPNQLHFTIFKPPAVASEDMYFNWFEIEYPRRFQAEGGQLFFSRNEAGTPWKYQVTGFPSDGISVYDLTDSLYPRLVDEAYIAGQAATFQAGHPGVARYLAVEGSAIRTPASITYYVPPDLFSSSNGADYLVITHDSFAAGARRLADYRAGQGLRARVIDIEDLYNEFNDGIYHPLAIKSFLAYVFSSWQAPAPSYALLVGGGHWNFKGYTGQSPNNYWSVPIYMPPHLVWVDPWQGEVDSANRLANVVGNDILPDLSIGRLPVDTPAQFDAVIDKVMAYEQGSWQPWQRELVFVADDTPDPAGDFVWISNTLINHHIPPAYRANRVYLNDHPDDITQVLADTLNRTGALFVNYIGHGADERWADEGILRTTAAQGDKDNPSLNNLLLLTNGDRLPVVLSMTCLDGYWIHTLPNKISLAVELLRTANKGAVATFSPTGLGVATGHDVLNRAFYDALFQDGVSALGPATVSARLALYGTANNYDLIDTFTVFGDPALRLRTRYTSWVFLPVAQK